MTFAWYGHLKDGQAWPLWKAILASWFIALFEYCLAVPANRLGYGEFSGFELKVIQEVVTLAVFIAFAVAFLKERLAWNYLVAFAFLGVAAFFAFAFKAPGPVSCQAPLPLDLRQVAGLLSPRCLRGDPVPKTDLLQGTLDLLLLRILALGPNHGWGISNRIRQTSARRLNASQGSLYPALHRLELRGEVRSEMTASENNRRARVYTITRGGPAPARGRAKELGALRPVDAARARRRVERRRPEGATRCWSRLIALRPRHRSVADESAPSSTTSWPFICSRRSRRTSPAGLSPAEARRVALRISAA